MSTVIVLFFGYLFYQSWKQLLPLYIEKRKQEIEVLQKTTETLGTVAITQTAATSVLNKIGEQVGHANGKLDGLDKKMDDCLEKKDDCDEEETQGEANRRSKK